MHLVGKTRTKRMETAKISGTHIQKTISFRAATSDVHSRITRVRDQILHAAERSGVNGNDLTDLQIALGEALGNAVRHGSDECGGGKISVECKVVGTEFVVNIDDSGCPFDCECIPVPDFDQLPECGMGVHLMRTVMDRVEFTRNNQGNSVRLIKRLSNKRSHA